MITYLCHLCEYVASSQAAIDLHIAAIHGQGKIQDVIVQQAKRDPANFRYDILTASFIRKMAEIASFGAAKYGDFNWTKSRLTGKKGPVNHMMNHLTSYVLNEPYDHPEIGTDRKNHLAAIAFNAMMEWWYEENLKDSQA